MTQQNTIRTTQPQAPTTIAYSNPITKGLLLAITPNQLPQSASVQGTKPVARGGVMAFGFNTFGTGTTDAVSVKVPNPLARTIIVQAFHRTGAEGALYAIRDGVWANETLYLNGDAVQYVYRRETSWGYWTWDLGLFLPSARQRVRTLVLTYDSVDAAAVPRLWVDGIGYSPTSSTQPVGIVPPRIDNVYIGNSEALGSPWDGGISLTAVLGTPSNRG